MRKDRDTFSTWDVLRDWSSSRGGGVCRAAECRLAGRCLGPLGPSRGGVGGRLSSTAYCRYVYTVHCTALWHTCISYFERFSRSTSST